MPRETLPPHAPVRPGGKDRPWRLTGEVLHAARSRSQARAHRAAPALSQAPGGGKGAVPTAFLVLVLVLAGLLPLPCDPCPQAMAGELAPRPAPPARKMPPAKAVPQAAQGAARTDPRVDPARLGDLSAQDRPAAAAWLEALARTLREREALAPARATLYGFLEDLPGRPDAPERTGSAPAAEAWEGREALASLAAAAKALDAALAGRGREFGEALGRLARERGPRPPDGLWTTAMDLDYLLGLESEVRGLLLALLARDLEARMHAVASSSPASAETAPPAANRELARRVAAFKGGGPVWTGPGGLAAWKERTGAALAAGIGDNARLLALDRELAAGLEAPSGTETPAGQEDSDPSPGDQALKVGQARAFLARRILDGNARMSALDPQARLDRPVFLHLSPLSPLSSTPDLETLARPAREALEELVQATGQRLAPAVRVREALAALAPAGTAPEAPGLIPGGEKPGISAGSCPDADLPWPARHAQVLDILDRALALAQDMDFSQMSRVVSDPVLAARAVDANRAMEAVVRQGPCLLSSAAAWVEGTADQGGPDAAALAAPVRGLAQALDRLAASLGRDRQSFLKLRAACARILNEASPRFLEAVRAMEADRNGTGRTATALDQARRDPALLAALKQRQALVRGLKTDHFEAIMHPVGLDPCRDCPALTGDWTAMDRAGPLPARALSQLTALAVLAGDRPSLDAAPDSARPRRPEGESAGQRPDPEHDALALVRNLEYRPSEGGWGSPPDLAAQVLAAAPDPPGRGEALWPALAVLAAHGPGCLRAWPLDPAPDGFWRGLGLDSPAETRAAAGQASLALDQAAKALQERPTPRLAGLALWPPAGCCPSAEGVGRSWPEVDKTAAWLAAAGTPAAETAKAKAGPQARTGTTAGIAARKIPGPVPAPGSRTLEAASAPDAREVEARGIQDQAAPAARSVQAREAPQARSVQEQKAPEARSIQARDIQAKDIQSKDIQAKDIEAKDIDSKEIDSKDIKAKDIKSKEIKAKDIKAKDIKAQKLEKKEGPEAQEIEGQEAPKAVEAPEARTIEKQEAPPPVNW